MDGETILIVDDEMYIRELVGYNLIAAGYQVRYAASGEEALQICAEITPALIVLDIMLPGIDGMEVCRRLKQSPGTASLPILMLTAKGDELDKVLGLELGADDYMTKPFSVRELGARVKALLRRMTQTVSDVRLIQAGDLVIDTNNYEARLAGVKVDFTLKEFELLKLLAQNKGRVLSRDQLLDQVWGYEFYGETRTVDVHIRHIRQKLGDDVNKYIETVRGVGYRFSQKVD